MLAGAMLLSACTAPSAPASVGGLTVVAMPQAADATPVQTMTREDALRLASDADRALAAGRVADAGAAYVRIATAFPDDASAWFRLGTIYLRTAQYGAAQYACERALRFEPGMAKAQANLALAHLHQFRAAAAQAAASADVPPENRKALASLIRDVDHALVPAAAARARTAGEAAR